jgi:hypothetical protein
VALIIDGKPEELPGLVTASWFDNPRLRLKRDDYRPRSTRWVRNIVLHTTKGIPGGKDMRPQVILPGLGPDTDVETRIARLWSTDGRGAGAHLVVDHDGGIACLADLMTEAAFHAGSCNTTSIGIEIFQGAGAELYAGQLDAVVALVDWLTRRFGIQRQIPAGYHGKPCTRLELGAIDFVGVFGHRDCSSNRGEGDPGDEVFRMLALAGYEQFDLDIARDRMAWKARQRDMAITPIDGVPGPATRDVLARRGRPFGMWVPRPGDAMAAGVIS